MQDPRDYTQQINVVIDHINTHLDQNLDVKSLAGLTHLSPFHFHRIFSDAMGEPLAKYVMRKRLELAAIYLRHDVYKPIAEIAADTGFHSSNVFCRNFKRHFGMTAVEYRRKMEQQESKNHPSEHNNVPYQRSYFRYFYPRKSFDTGGKSMQCDFELKHMDEVHMVYCRHYGAYTQMQRAFEKLMQWAYPRGLVTAPNFRLAAIYHDNPQVTPVDRLISDACLIVERPVKTDGEIGTFTMPAGQYAVGRFEISWEEFQAAWSCMFQLIEEHGCQCCGLAYEVYLNNSEEHPQKKWLIDICIPVAVK